MAEANSSPQIKPPTEFRSVALYASVSTIWDQSPEMQLRELREYAGRRGWSIAGEFID